MNGKSHRKSPVIVRIGLVEDGGRENSSPDTTDFYHEDHGVLLQQFHLNRSIEVWEQLGSYMQHISSELMGREFKQ